MCMKEVNKECWLALRRGPAVPSLHDVEAPSHYIMQRTLLSPNHPEHHRAQLQPSIEVALFLDLVTILELNDEHVIS